MEKKLFLLLLLVFLVACGTDKPPDHGHLDVKQPLQSDREPNGGMLRVHLADKAMHDEFFEAQFTPAGDLYKTANLQLYNYNYQSDKFPQFIITLNHAPNNLLKWEKKQFPLNLIVTIAADRPPMRAEGRLTISRVTEYFVEGQFDGELNHPHGERTFPIRGEFKAILRLNV